MSEPAAWSLRRMLARCTVALVVISGVTPMAQADDVKSASSVPETASGVLGSVDGASPLVVTGPSPSVRLVPETVANGQPFLVELTLHREVTRTDALPVVDEATIGSRRGILVKRTPEMLTLLFSVPIEERREVLPLRIQVRREGGDAVIVEKQVAIAVHPYEESHLRVAKKFTSPPKAAQKRAARESKELERVFAVSHPEPLLTGGFVKPALGEKTSSFGTLRTYNKKRDRSRHLGLDLDGGVGDPIFATERGRVVMTADRYYSGNTVVIDHGASLFSMYLHLSAFDVKLGDLVEPGQLVGKVGSTGRVTGPHLHFSVKLDGEHLDPESVLSLMPAAQEIGTAERVPATASSMP